MAQVSELEVDAIEDFEDGNAFCSYARGLVFEMW